MLKPQEFIPLIRDIYYDIANKYFTESQSINRSAFTMVMGADALLIDKNQFLYELLRYMNSLYYNIVDRNEKIFPKNDELFLKSPHFDLNSEEIIFW